MEQKSSTADREIFISRKLNAPVEMVWELWTKPEHITNWWGPNEFSNTISTMNVTPGGEWKLVMHSPDGTDYYNESIFREVILHKKIVYEHISYPRHIATVDFEEQGEYTFIKWHMLFESAEEFIAVARAHKLVEGMKQNMKKLENYIVGVNGGR
jgi:uncharacterized protein YndB with AHSA1/START domain